MQAPQRSSPNLQSPSFLLQPTQPSLSSSSYNLPAQNAISALSQTESVSPLEKARREERARDPFFRAYDSIRTNVYANLTPEDQSYLAEISVADALNNQNVKKVSSKPDNDLDDLTAYIQGQLQGKDGRDRERSSHLVPVPLRYRQQPAHFEEFDQMKKEKKKVVEKAVLFDYQFTDENWKRDQKLMDEFMGRGTHAPPLIQMEELLQRRMKEGIGVQEDAEIKPEEYQFRRIFPEDPAWKLSVIDRLSEICLHTIQNTFHDMPYQLAALPTELQQRFLPDLPVATEINIYLAADYFHNENYWERSCKARWGPALSRHTHGSWKLTYIERGFQDLIENYVPLQSDPNILLNDLLNIGEYVLQLQINQLLPPVRHTFGNFAAMVDAQLTKHVNFTDPVEESQVDPETHRRDSAVLRQIPMADEIKKYLGNEQFPAVKTPKWSDKAKIKFQRLINRELDLNKGIDEGDRILMDITRELDDTPAHPRTMNPFLAADHINLVPVVANMPHLMDLQIRYGIAECGMNFSWRLFQFTLNDARRLAEALVICASLRRLCLAYCNIDDAKGTVVCSALLDHPNLAILELQCNKLGNQTAAVIARMIKRSEVLNKVDLGDNQIGVDGAKALARSLVRGVSLRILNLHFNEIGDLGAEAFCLVLKSCITFLQQLMISGNKITGAIVDLLTDAMKVNRKLEKYDLSANELEGVAASRKIQEALAQSHHIQEFNIHENHFSADFETCIQEIVARNQDARQEQILVELEHTFDFNIKHVKFPSEDHVKESSDDETSSSEEK